MRSILATFFLQYIFNNTWSSPELFPKNGRGKAVQGSATSLVVIVGLNADASAGSVAAKSASLIGRSGSSAFRLSTNSVSTPPAGSCFSSESAPRPFHHGIRRRGGTIFGAALPLDERQVQADIRSHLIRRPARDIIPPLGGTRVSSY